MAFNAYSMPVGYNPYPINNFNTIGQYPIQQRQPGPEECHYCHGIEGANAYQLPPGVTKVTLWDEEKNCFYVKGYDNNGIPRVLAWNDYQPHTVEPEQEKQAAPDVDMTKYVTKTDLNEMLSKLTIGANGRIVIANEHDA